MNFLKELVINNNFNLFFVILGFVLLGIIITIYLLKKRKEYIIIALILNILIFPILYFIGVKMIFIDIKSNIIKENLPKEIKLFTFNSKKGLEAINNVQILRDKGFNLKDEKHFNSKINFILIPNEVKVFNKEDNVKKIFKMKTSIPYLEVEVQLIQNVFEETFKCNYSLIYDESSKKLLKKRSTIKKGSCEYDKGIILMNN